MPIYNPPSTTSSTGAQGIQGVPGIDGEDADSWPLFPPSAPVNIMPEVVLTLNQDHAITAGYGVVAPNPFTVLAGYTLTLNAGSKLVLI